MKYAAEVIDLLAAYPGREFKMAEIVRHVVRGRDLSARERNAVRQGVGRVLGSLGDAGQVDQRGCGKKLAMYSWTVGRVS